MNEEHTFRVDLKATPVDLGGQTFTIKELTGAQRDEYLNKNLGRMRLDPITGEAKGFKDYKGLHTDLLCMCMYDAEGKVVSKKNLEQLPAATVGGLFKLANDLNALEETEEETGND